MEKFNSALSIIFYIIWIPLGILLAIVLFLFLNSNMGKTQMTGTPQGSFMEDAGVQRGQVQQSGGELQQPQQGRQQMPQVSGSPQGSNQGSTQQGGQQNLSQPPLQK